MIAQKAMIFVTKNHWLLGLIEIDYFELDVTGDWRSTITTGLSVISPVFDERIQRFMKNKS
jgi:hypothetical protein